jgi:hypothetical protein
MHSVERNTNTSKEKTMFYAANNAGKMFAKFIVSGGVKKPAFRGTYEKSEAFRFETAEEATSFAVNVFGKAAGPAVPVAAAKPVNTEFVAGLPRPTRHQREEAAIHGDHELYT